MSAAAAPLPSAATNGAPPHDPRLPAPLSGERAYEHIDDLKAKVAQGYNVHSSISELIRIAGVGVDQAYNLITFRRPDLAFVEFVRASEIVVDVIPRHKDYTHFTLDQPERAKKLTLLQKRIGAGNEQFAAIKQIIINNNKRSGVRPRRVQDGHVKTESAPAVQAGVNGGLIHPRVPPPPSPKPEALHGRPISNVNMNGTRPAPTSDLSERFAQLRTNTTQRPDSRGSNHSIHSSPVAMPAPADYNGRSSFEPLARTSSVPYKPQGPRGMPNGTAPPFPAPIVIPNLPQAPQAAYSPARNMDTMGGFAPPRHTVRSLASGSTRRSSMAPSSTASAHAPNGTAHSGEYFPNSTTNSRPAAAFPIRRTSTIIPMEAEMLPVKMFDYMQRYSVLVLDFRSRLEFDQGHINTRHIVCVDPLTIRQGMSAEQLQDSLVLSPETEQDVFHQRDQYDFVVYYDNATQFRNFLIRPDGQRQTCLKYLHEALVDFNQEKPLRRPPILLQGGLEAWVEMIGSNALASSDTQSSVKQGRPIKRRPLAVMNAAAVNGDSQLRIPKRQARIYNPLDAEETQFFNEKARAESVALPNPPVVSEDGARESIAEGEDEGEETAEPSSAIQEFLDRFPDAGDVDQYAFAGQKPVRRPPDAPASGGVVYPAPLRASVYAQPPDVPAKAATDNQDGRIAHEHGIPPELPAKMSAYPPPTSTYPQVPRRPAPAAPRMSYSGISDRAPSASQPASRSTSGQNVPYMNPKFMAKNIRLPHTGLYNFRNTCYMNSIIQALSATTPLSIFLLGDDYKSHLQSENWKGSKDIGFITVHYSNLLRNLWKDDVSVVRPTTFRKVIQRKWEDFNNDDQQDAKEFFDVLLEYLHQDMNTNWAGTVLRALTPQEEATRERLPRSQAALTEWQRATHRESSYIYSLFAGQYASKLTCETCAFTSTTYDLMTSISVEIPTTTTASSNPATAGPTLDDCLRSYCSEERLTRAEKWECPRCRLPREARKRITLTRAPQFLVIHFKRFRSNGPGRQSSKLNTAVDFPLQSFDLGPYMLPPETPTHSSGGGGGSDPAMTGPFTYSAYAVVRHIGATMQSGHYVTAARDRGRGCWRWYNDQRVEDFQPVGEGGGGSGSGGGGGGSGSVGDRLQSEQAYIVFFQRDGGGQMVPQGKM
ncbi:ubiquitin-specific protease doa4 [Friedmanniomyces endolithicus]|uniref:Ubiquitin-specific protease doa4 n=1 Tax=Friedmanniomyces endolithicus TaxID=329885 RepID=A0AAN6FHJ2_9PEZI|nr:ubiquitin-specific protease doa4 [Friedmanniomyces endolithicus]